MGLSADAAAASAVVSTMTGPVPCGSLGTTLMHEHILWFGGPKLTDPGYTPIPEQRTGLEADRVMEITILAPSHLKLFVAKFRL
jgi:predicted metal-dependent phosphotriesterase family hydrolase